MYKNVTNDSGTFFPKICKITSNKTIVNLTMPVSAAEHK